ncbi:unnamed protein product [Dibothriocephalus latus]|uniref:Protein xylosyltransferase n=1 Tax=Dibothriocephalus latus TaxID=60516 RepID=A0A3P6PFG5_DIBLA|nr:unnamed protein product [Dibothriocephalus latus]
MLIVFVVWNFLFQVIIEEKPVNAISVAEEDKEEDKASRCAFLFSNNVSVNDHHEFKRLTPLRTTDYFLSLNNHSGQLCQAFKRDLFPTKVPLTTEELAFPLAFAISVFQSINQVARLLRLIHRPHNFYVIHVDQKSPLEFYEAVQEIAKCFDANVAVVPRNESIKVVWGDYTVLEQELVSARMLLQAGKWRYLINLTGQEMPLKTNLELVQALRMLNGSNIVEATFKERFKFRIPRRRASFQVSIAKIDKIVCAHIV